MIESVYSMEGTTIQYPNFSQLTLSGRLSRRYQGNLRYLVEIYKTRKDWMLEPFQNRGVQWVLEPLRHKKGELQWAGEYAGKWLDAASLTAASSQDEQIGEYARKFAAAMIAAQGEDGYLGIEVPAKRGLETGWDFWNIKYALAGLLTHYEVFQDQSSLQAALKGADWVINQYGMVSDSNHPIFSSAMEGTVNVNIVDQFARLYRFTGERRFIQFASSVLTNFPPFIRMRSTPKAPLWHAYNLLGCLCGVVELILADPGREELAWVEKVWEDIVTQHLYPTGSISYNELLAESAPNDTPVEAGQPERNHQETCATVEWLLFSALLYQATGKARYIDRMEQTIYNALLAAQSMDGMQWMYYTPLRYEKRWFSGPTSCCYWSGPRGIARLPGWIYAIDAEGIRINLYESSEATLPVDGHPVVIQQDSLYPDCGKVTVNFQPEAPLGFALRLRIPPGARSVQVALNGNATAVGAGADGFVSIQRTWAPGDQVLLEFEIPRAVRTFLNPNYGVTERGPEILAVDQGDNPSVDIDQIALCEEIDLISNDPVNDRRRYSGQVLAGGKSAQVVFTPYADCGGEGSRFRTAFPL